MPPINYGNPDANPDPNWGCSYSNTNLSNFNSPVYWTRNKDLPFDKFWYAGWDNVMLPVVMLT